MDDRRNALGELKMVGTRIENRGPRFFDPRPHRWKGKLGSGNDEWFFFPIRLVATLIMAWMIIEIIRGK
jgi:hypothetical protein